MNLYEICNTVVYQPLVPSATDKCYAFPRLMLGKLWKELHCGFVTEIGTVEIWLCLTLTSATSGSNCWTILFEVPKSRHEVNVEPPAASTARISSRDLFCKMLPLRFAYFIPFMIFISHGVQFIFQQFIWTSNSGHKTLTLLLFITTTPKRLCHWNWLWKYDSV